jgi:hypothetical protein
MDYEYQGKKEEIHKLKYIVFEIYILSIIFHKIFFACEYQLRKRKKMCMLLKSYGKEQHGKKNLKWEKRGG